MASTTPSFGRRTAAPPALKLVSAPRVVVGGLALALLLVGPSGAIRLLTDDASPEVATAELRLGAASLRVPSSWVAAPLTRDAVRLAMPWPELGEARSAVASPDRVLIVELRAAAGDDPAERARERHARFVTAETSSEHGLVRRGFAPGSPYARDELVQGVADGDAFEALCPGAALERRPGGSEAAERCVARWRQARLDVTLRFPRTALPDWRDLRGRVDDLIERVTAPAS